MRLRYWKRSRSEGVRQVVCAGCTSRFKTTRLAVTRRKRTDVSRETSMRAGDDGSRAWYTRARRTQGERGKGANRKAGATGDGSTSDGGTCAQEGGPIPRARAFRRPALPPRQPQGSAAPRWGATSRRLGRPRSGAEPRRASRSRCSCGGRAQTTGAGGPR